MSTRPGRTDSDVADMSPSVGQPGSLPTDNANVATAMGKSAPLPKHHEISSSSRTVSVACLAAAAVLLLWNVVRLGGSECLWNWWTPFVVAAGILAADFASGMIHWSADTWGRVSMPVIGWRVLHPFRVHHVNPADFLRRSFIDTNGDVALLMIPFFIIALALPANGASRGIPAVFVTALATIGLLTNQVHQWSHRPRPPFIVRFLQDYRVILSREAHRRHHTYPYTTYYCITTGWCNSALAAIDFYRRLERVVSKVTGLVPRNDEHEFIAEVASRSIPVGNNVGERNA